MNTPLAACWTAEQARRVFVTEALEGGDAIFLATHTPIRGFDIAGRDAGEIDGDDEHAILDALANPERRHAFSVVQGEPGSGKSHLIRWLSVNWPVKSDLKLLLRRADGSLEGALKQLKDHLPAEFQTLFDNLGQRQRANLEGRANVFALTLAATLEPNHFDKPIGDETWCTNFAPAELLSSPDVRRAWNGPTRILNLLEGAGGDRNSATASFNLFDVESLANACDRLRPSAVSARAMDLVRRLQKEAETIQSYREQQWQAEELVAEAGEFLPTSLALIRALNARRNEAIRNVLGVSADSLKSLFRTVREALVARNQRLVLLLEDITSWEGLDDSLIDVLVDNAEAAGGDGEVKVCPLISVVGITPDFYDTKLPGNIRQRITHEIKLGHSHGGLQDVATMRDPGSRRTFVARYLAATRASLTSLEGWRETIRRSPETPPPNNCPTCPRQEHCFKVFGDEKGVGLFPFTAGALDRFFEALKENDNGQTWRTPRGVLQAVLNLNLGQPEVLEQSRFPVALIESKAIREDRRSDTVLSNRLERIVANRIADPDEQRRMRRMLAYWADPARADTTDNDGELALAGAKRSIFEAFGLDWIGEDTASTDPAAPLQPPEPLVPEKRGEEEAPPEQETRGPSPKPKPGPPIIPAKPKRLTANRTQLEQLQHELRSWSKGGTIDNASTWNKYLFEVIQKVDPRRFGTTPYLFDKLVTPDMVKLQGSTMASRQYLVVGADPWVRDGFEAYLALRFDKSVSSEDASFHRRNLAMMMRRLEKATAAYIGSRIPKLEGGGRWSPAGAVTQVLVARAWLRGTVRPQASVPEHMRAILSDELEAASDPRARSMPWQEWLSATDKWHERLRSELRGMVSLSIGDGGGGAGLTDASEMAGAIQRMKDTSKSDEVPQDQGSLPHVLNAGRELSDLWREKRALIDRTESKQLRDRVGTLFTLLRQRSVDEHFARVDAAITKVSDLMHQAAPELVSNWKQAYARVKSKLQDGAGQRLELFMVSLEDPDEGLPEKMALRLGWMAKAPAKDLADILDLANLGEKVVEQLHQHANDCVIEAAGTASLSEVHRVGSALKAAARRGSTGASS
jgi:hypothetical protein